VELRPDFSLNPDKALMRRRECEFEIFRSVEETVELPAITAGFTSIDAFLARAQTILQRRTLTPVTLASGWSKNNSCTDEVPVRTGPAPIKTGKSATILDLKAAPQSMVKGLRS